MKSLSTPSIQRTIALLLPELPAALILLVENSPRRRSSITYAIINPEAMMTVVKSVWLKVDNSLSEWSSITSFSLSSSSVATVVCKSVWLGRSTLSMQLLQGWTCKGYENRTKITMASWPTAIKSDVEGYIVIILAPTCHNGISQFVLSRFFQSYTLDPNVR